MITRFLSTVAFLTVVLFQVSGARQGCCSHHGGVCGCGCCDGTPLSATCAPYYDCGKSSTHSSNSTYDKDEIIQLQTNLQKLGYFKSTIDGVLGKITKDAIKSFQRDNGLEVTGMADSNTIQEIKDAVEQKDQTK